MFYSYVMIWNSVSRTCCSQMLEGTSDNMWAPAEQTLKAKEKKKEKCSKYKETVRERE